MILGCIPTLVDNTQSPPYTVIESAAQILYLSEAYDKNFELSFKDPFERYDAYQWLLFWHGTGAPNTQHWAYFTFMSSERNPGTYNYKFPSIHATTPSDKLFCKKKKLEAWKSNQSIKLNQMLMNTYTQAHPKDLKRRQCAHSVCWKPTCPGSSAEKAETTWLVRAKGSIPLLMSARGRGSRRLRHLFLREDWMSIRIWRSISNVLLNGRLVSAELARIIRHDEMEKCALL